MEFYLVIYNNIVSIINAQILFKNENSLWFNFSIYY